MKKKINYSITILLLGLLFFSLLPYKYVFSLNNQIFNSSKFVNAPVLEPVYIVLDNDDYEVLPQRFRKTTDISSISSKENINTTGLDTLNISGSQQFSKMNLPLLLKSIDTNLPIIDFDLRQESHGFINGLPISFKNEHNNASENLTDSQILKKEKEQLDSIKIGVPLTLSNKSNKTIIPKEVIDEKALAASNNIKYVRIFATDEIPPTPPVIDSFVNEVKNIDEKSWLHFHCKEGIGRTTTFMIFYDMMNNYKNVSADDIINRQLALVDFNADDIRLLTSERRINSFNLFYNYCKDTNGNFNIKYSDYIAKNK